MEIKQPNKTYHSTKHCVYSCQYHVIFCPKYRRPVLEEDVATALKALVLEKQREYGYEVLDLEVLSDHVHLLLDVNPKIGIFTIVNKIKCYTSRRLREDFSKLKSRLPTLWTHSKFISSVGAVMLAAVNKYLKEQKGK